MGDAGAFVALFKFHGPFLSNEEHLLVLFQNTSPHQPLFSEPQRREGRKGFFKFSWSERTIRKSNMPCPAARDKPGRLFVQSEMNDIVPDFFDMLDWLSLPRSGSSQLWAPLPGGHNVLLSVLGVLCVAPLCGTGRAVRKMMNREDAKNAKVFF